MGRAEATRVMPLGDCAEVLPGFSVRGRMDHDPDGTHQLVLSRHLEDGVPYVYEPAHELRMDPGARDTSRYHLAGGDVLFMSRGIQNRAWVMREVPDRTMPPVSFYILRPREGLDGRYLAWYLNQKPAQAIIEQIRTGAGTPIVQRKVFENMQIVVPPVATQREIAELAELLTRERDLRSALAQATDTSHRMIGQMLIDNLRLNAQEDSHD